MLFTIKNALMLNQTTNIKMGSNTQNVQFNTPSTGMIQRSHPKSVFIKCAMSSETAKFLFPEDGSCAKILTNRETKYDYSYDSRGRSKVEDTLAEAQVLQVLIFGDNYFFVEVVEIRFLTEEQK